MKKKSFAEALALGLSGATGGAQTGYKVGGDGGAQTGYKVGGDGGAQTGYKVGGGGGAMLGGLLGGAAGVAGGLFDAEANAPADELNMQEQGLTNDLLQQQLKGAKRKNRTDQTAENGFNLFRGFLGSAFKANQPTSFGGALKAYPGLGNQGVA